MYIEKHNTTSYFTPIGMSTCVSQPNCLDVYLQKAKASSCRQTSYQSPGFQVSILPHIMEGIIRICNYLVQGQVNPHRCKDSNSATRICQILDVTNLFNEDGFSRPYTKWWLIVLTSQTDAMLCVLCYLYIIEIICFI